MSETETGGSVPAQDIIEFKADAGGPVSSASSLRPETAVFPERRPEAFKRLAEAGLPRLSRDNRAWLQMQSPNRLFFYWSVRQDPYQTLSRAIGPAIGSYTLVIKLIDLKTGAEEMHRAEASGSWWFDVEPNTDHRAEVGFYAPNRPYIRILFSNTVSTPRSGPSPRSARGARAW